MNITRNGKIARLSHAVREELNRRLQNGESGTSLCAWLHSLPEVQRVLREEFGGRAINAQNLTEWRQGGYGEWQDTAEARMLAKELGQEMLAEPAEGRAVPTETLAVWLSGKYAVATRRVNEATSKEERWRLLREMCNDVVKLRQCDLLAQRLELEGQWRELRAAKGGNLTVSSQSNSG